RKARLYQHLARLFAPAGAPADLRQRGEQALGGAVVGRQQRAVGVQHAHQRQVREVVPLGKQLRADQDVALTAVYAFQRARELAALAGIVPVDAQDAGIGKNPGQRFLDALRTASERLQVDVAAGGADARNRFFGAAVVAAQSTARLARALGRGVQNQARAAARAARCPAASLAGENRRIAPAVDEHQA